MRTLPLLAGLLLSLAACENPFTSHDDPSLSTACTLMGSVDGVNIRLHPANPLPDNILVMSGTNTLYDECHETGGLHDGALRELPGGDLALWFPVSIPWVNGQPAPPTIDKMDLQFFKRKVCDDVDDDAVDDTIPYIFAEVKDLAIKWGPDYANGVKCGITGYSGEASASL